MKDITEGPRPAILYAACKCFYPWLSNYLPCESGRVFQPYHWAIRARISYPACPGCVGRLEMPRLRLSTIVLEGSDSRILRRGVGRLQETADPGDPGNVVLGGHRDTFFRPLRAVRAGDRVTLVTPGGGYRYVVEWTAVVDPADNAPLKATPDRSLTLVTCYPFHYIGPAPQRFIVRARQVAADVSAAASY